MLERRRDTGCLGGNVFRGFTDTSILLLESSQNFLSKYLSSDLPRGCITQLIVCLAEFIKTRRDIKPQLATNQTIGCNDGSVHLS